MSFVTLLGCNYTGDMNVQPIRETYNANYVRPPVDASPFPSVPVNPTPANYWGIPYRASPVARSWPTGLLEPGANPYVGIAPTPVGPNNPTPNDQASVDRGRLLYQATCRACHGENGTGQGTIAGAWFARPPVNKPPANLTSPEVQNLPDSQIFEVITNGFGAMPSLRTELDPVERWDVIHYVRTLRAQ